MSRPQQCGQASAASGAQAPPPQVMIECPTPPENRRSGADQSPDKDAALGLRRQRAAVMASSPLDLASRRWRPG